MKAAAAVLRSVPRLAGALPRLTGALPRLAGALRRLRGGGATWRAPSVSATLRWRLLVAAGAGVLLICSYLFWLRDSGLVAVEEVDVSGLTIRDRAQVRRELVAAAREMTTLHVRPDELEAAVGGYPAVRGLEVSADFPHALAIEVIEHRPVAVLIAGGARIPVARDGSLLRGVPVERPVPVIEARLTPRGSRLGALEPLGLLRAIAAAPAPLLGRLAGASRDGERGLVVRVRHGPELLFGDGSRLRAKWAAATRVLADPGAAGAAYVDVRLPERPAAGQP